MIIITTLFIFFGITVYFIRTTYLGELILSFLPYLSVIFFLIFLYWLIIFGKILYTKGIDRNIIGSFVLFILSGITFFLYIYPIINFYGTVKESREEKDDTLKVLYSNIYKDNDKFESIKEIIENENPDMVMFVEYSESHERGLGEFMDEKFLYKDKTNRSKIAGGNMVFSKYPIIIRKDVAHQKVGEKYGYVQINKNGESYFFYLVHTSSPVSKKSFLKRNQQLISLKKDFYLLQEEEKGNEKIVMIGDFNVSPRSIYYRDFSKSLEGELENKTRGKNILFTRNLSEMLYIHKDFDFLPQWFKSSIRYFPILWSHIDHIFMSKNISLNSLKKIHINGSDHDGFVFEIK